MRIVISEKQFKKIVLKSIGSQELSEEGEEGGTPESGASSDGEKKTGATKWESGVTRGPANQIGNTKWSDIVGTQLKRGKANPLKEQDIPDIEPKYDETELNRLPVIPQGNNKGKVIFEDAYTTYWGQKITLKIDDYDVTLWEPSMRRQLSFRSNQDGYWTVKRKTKEGELIDYLYAPPPEGYLRKLFPDNTIKEIKDRKTGKAYNIILRYVDLNAEYNEKVSKQPNPLNLKMEKPEATQWIPKYGYFYHTDEYLTEGEIFPFIKKATIPESYQNFTLTHYTATQDIKRYFNRKSYSGLDVPQGFDPNSYDTYVFERKKLEDRFIAIGRTIRKKFPNYFKGEYFQKYPNNPEFEKLLTEQKDIIKKIQDLYKKYASPLGKGGVPEFSFGLPPEQREKFISLQKELKEKYDRLMSEQTSIMLKHSTPIGYSLDGYPYYSDENIQAQKRYNTLKDEYEQKVKQINTVFNFDYWEPSIFGKRFDEIYDEWSTAIAIGGQVVVAILSGGIANIVRGTAWAAYRALIYPTLDVLFNGFMAAYELHRGKDAEALLSIVCTLIPIAKYGFNIGKVSEEECLRLATKIRNAGPNLLSDPKKLQEFIALCDDQERYILRNLLSLPAEKIKDGTEMFYKDLVDTAENMKIKIPAAGFKVWGPPFFKELGFEAGPPTLVGVINGFAGWIKDKTNKLPYTDEELMQIKTAFEEEAKKGNVDNIDGFEAFFSANELVQAVKRGDKKAKEIIDDMAETFLESKKLENVPEEVAKKIRIELGLVKKIMIEEKK